MRLTRNIYNIKMKSLTQHIEERLITNQRFDEKLIINKDYKNVENSLLELAKKIGSVSQNIKGRVTKNEIRYNWLWLTYNGMALDTLLNFDNEILNNINKYDKSCSLTYSKNYPSGLGIHKMLKEILTRANEEDASELLFQVNPRAPKNNVQLIRIKDDDVLIYIAGKSLFKKGKFDVDKIERFKIILMYND